MWVVTVFVTVMLVFALYFIKVIVQRNMGVIQTKPRNYNLTKILRSLFLG